jgi:hypothetical protein
MNNKLLAVRLPEVVTEEDYHGFYVLQEHLTTIFKRKITVLELGINDAGRYVALVYSGRKPRQSVIDKYISKYCVED